MADRLLEIATRPEGPSSRAKLPFDKLARVLDVPTVPTPGLAKAAPQAERVTPPPPDLIPTKKENTHQPPGPRVQPDMAGHGLSGARFDTGAAHRAAQRQAHQAEAAAAPAAAPTLDSYPGRTLTEALQTKPLDRLAAILDKPGDYTPLTSTPPGRGRDFDRDR